MHTLTQRQAWSVQDIEILIFCQTSISECWKNIIISSSCSVTLLSYFVLSSCYSHLSNKRDVMLTNFGKLHPAQNKNPTCTFIDLITKFSIFLKNLMRFFSRSFWDINLYSSIKIDGKSPVDFATFAPLPLHIYFNLNNY